MENKRNILIIVAVIAIVAIALTLSLFNTDSYKNVDESYVENPIANESVRFTGTYFGKTTVGSENDLSSDVDVVRVGIGNDFVFIHGNFDEFEGKQGHDFKFEGKFNVEDTGKQKAVVNGLSVMGYEFYPDKVEQV